MKCCARPEWVLGLLQLWRHAVAGAGQDATVASCTRFHSATAATFSRCNCDSSSNNNSNAYSYWFSWPPSSSPQPISFCAEVPATARVHVYLASVMVLVSCEDVCMLSVRRLYPCLFLKLRCLISCLQPPVPQFLVVCAAGSRSSGARALVSMGNQEGEKDMTTRDKTRG